ncbi:MAG: oligopeptide:H+ symporter [Polyangiaceae bacterium]
MGTVGEVGEVGETGDAGARRAPGFLATLRQHPRGFWFVFWGELAERASFYGMRTVLALYLVDELRFGEAGAASVMSFFLAAAYLAPLLGGYIADRFLGRYRTIAAFALPYLAGHVVLGAVPTRAGLGVALLLLALGSGAIKPNTSTLMGMIYEAEKKTALLGRAFSYFYAAINIGAAAAALTLPLARERWGYATALMVPAGLMAAAFALFVAGRRFYPAEPARKAATGEERAAARSTLGRLAGLFGLIAVFWFVYDQSSSTWIFFARERTDLTLWGSVKITADQIQGANPLLILVLTPMFNRLWAAIARRRGSELPDTRKMVWGFWIVTGAMGLMALAGWMSRAGKVSVWWLLAATFVITLAELCISVVGLELSFRRAAPGTKSAVTAAFLVTVFVGNTFGGLFAGLYGKLSPGAYFAVQAAIVACAALAFRRVARALDRPAEEGEGASGEIRSAADPAEAAGLSSG